MKKEKQIEELAEILWRACETSLSGCGEKDCNECMAKTTIDAGYRKQSEWISVEERLPESLTYVIVHDEDGTIGEAFHSYEGCFEWAANEKTAFVTHWMPLPEPPKGD